MEAGVRLKLLCSRLDEIEPALHNFLAEFDTLALSAFSDAFRPAVEVAMVAHKNRLEAEQAQVREALSAVVSSAACA